MYGTALFLYLVQVQDPGASDALAHRRSERMEQAQRNWASEEGSSASADDRGQEAAYQEHEFVRRFNTLMNALTDFASSYNAGVINSKKAKAVRKALRELEHSDWFRPAKGD